MKPPYTGRCVCDATRYQVNEAPLTLYACHCTDCQIRSGSAFGLSLWVNRAAVEVTKGRTESRAAKHIDGRERVSQACPTCGTRVWQESARRPEILIVRPGTLEDRSWLDPIAHIWTRSAQPWFVFPEGVPKYETQPEPFLDLVTMWKERHA